MMRATRARIAAGPLGGGARMLCCAALLSVLTACERESRPFRDLPRAEGPSADVQSPLQPGPPVAQETGAHPFQENAWGIAEGKRLFAAYNCSGCHAHGGGAIGPALMDDEWIYSFEPAGIYATIVEGRPNGMPSFKGRMPDHQVWQLVAYVLSMSGGTPIDAAPGRSDHLAARPPEMNTPFQGRRQTGHK